MVFPRPVRRSCFRSKTIHVKQNLKKKKKLALEGSRGWLSGYSAGLVIDRSRVRVSAGVAGEFPSPGSTFCADSYFGILFALPCTVSCLHYLAPCLVCNTLNCVSFAIPSTVSHLQYLALCLVCTTLHCVSFAIPCTVSRLQYLALRLVRITLHCVSKNRHSTSLVILNR